MLCFEKFPVTKAFMDKTGGIKIFRRKNLSHSAEDLWRGILLCFNRLGYRKTFCFRWLSHVFPWFFLSYSFKHNRRGTLLCCVS